MRYPTLESYLTNSSGGAHRSGAWQGLTRATLLLGMQRRNGAGDDYSAVSHSVWAQDSTPVQSAGVRKTTWLSRLRRRRDCPSGFGGDDEPSGRISET